MLSLKGGVIIKNKIISILVISLLIFTCIASLQNLNKINLLNSKFKDEAEIKDKSPSIDDSSSSILERGIYKTRTKELIKPGTYKVDVKPVGDNITLHIVDDSHKVTKRFNDSISFKTDIYSTTVFISIVIDDPVSYQNWTQNQLFKVDLERVVDDSNIPLLPLWSLVIIGGVYLAADAAYRRRFD